MLELVAENAALEDALYYLDQGLTDGVITVDVFMKEVRRLARKQFLARATMKKVRPLLQKREEAKWEVLVVASVIAVVVKSVFGVATKHYTSVGLHYGWARVVLLLPLASRSALWTSLALALRLSL